MKRMQFEQATKEVRVWKCEEGSDIKIHTQTTYMFTWIYSHLLKGPAAMKYTEHLSLWIFGCNSNEQRWAWLKGFYYFTTEENLGSFFSEVFLY